MNPQTNNDYHVVQENQFLKYDQLPGRTTSSGQVFCLVNVQCSLEEFYSVGSVRGFWTTGAHPQGPLQMMAHYSSLKTQQHSLVRRKKWECVTFIYHDQDCSFVSDHVEAQTLYGRICRGEMMNPGCVLTFRM